MGSVVGIKGSFMPKIVSEDNRARSVSLSLTAAQVYILERLASAQLRCGYSAVQAYRDVIDRAGAEREIYPYEYTSEGRVMTEDFKTWLASKEWSGLYASIVEIPDDAQNGETEYDGIDDES